MSEAPKIDIPERVGVTWTNKFWCAKEILALISSEQQENNDE